MSARSYITYSLGEARGVFPLDSIIEIYRVVGFDLFPDAPKRIIGACSFRGEALFGVDIQDVFAIGGHLFNADASLIISTSDNYRFGVLVDHIGDIIRVDDTQEVMREHIPAHIKDRCITRAYSIDNMMHFEVEMLSLFSEEEKNRLVEYSRNFESPLYRLSS